MDSLAFEPQIPSPLWVALAVAAEVDVRLRTLADNVPPADATSLAALAPKGETTDLAAAIAGALESDRPQGQLVVLLSDGIHNAGSAAPVLAAARQAKAMA